MVEAPTIICKNCGSTLEFSAAKQGLKCPYCGTVTEVPGSPAHEISETSTSLIVPMAMEEKEVRDAVLNHMASGNYTPDDLLDAANIKKLERYYAPAYLFEGEFDADWNASFGYDREEPYTDYKEVTEGSVTRRIPITAYRTVTDWHPVNGSASGAYSLLAFAGQDESSKLKQFEVDHTGPQVFVPYADGYTSGLAVRDFSILPADAFAVGARDRLYSIVEKSVYAQAHGDRQRDWHIEPRVSGEEVRKTLIPIAHVVFEYAGKDYNFFVHGADPTQTVADPLPVDTDRQSHVTVGFVPGLLAAAGTAGSFLLFSQDFSAATIPMLIAAGAFLFGIARRSAILDYSKQYREWAVSRKQAHQSNLALVRQNELQAVAASLKRPSKGVLARENLNPAIWAASILLFLATLLFPGIRLTHDSSVAESSSSSRVSAAVARQQDSSSPPAATPRSVQAYSKGAAATDTRPSAQQAYAPPATPTTPQSFTPPPPAVQAERVGPSFDCSMPSVSTQPLAQMICADTGLSWLDLKYVNTYQAVRATLDQPGQRLLGNEASDFVRLTTEACGLPVSGAINRLPTLEEAQCIKGRYEQQTIALARRLPPDGREEFRLSPEQAISLQKGLQQKGFLPTDATVDGVIGPATRSAIADWQRQSRYAPTGFASASMIQAITAGPSAMANPTAPPAQSQPNSPQPPVATQPRPAAQPPAGQLSCNWSGEVAFGMRRSIPHFLGEAPGFVIVNYNTSMHPVDIRVIYRGQTLTSTKGFQMGRGGISFDWRPLPGYYSVEVLLSGQRPDSRLAYSILCPK